MEKELNHSDDYESGEIRDSVESIQEDNDVPTVILTKTPPGKLAPKLFITGFLQKVKFAACNPALLYNSPTRRHMHQYPTTETFFYHF